MRWYYQARNGEGPDCAGLRRCRRAALGFSYGELVVGMLELRSHRRRVLRACLRSGRDAVEPRQAERRALRGTGYLTLPY
jgi:hypothetical protein